MTANGRPDSHVSAQDAEFAEQYLTDLNGTQAMLRVKPGISKQSAAVQASRTLRKPEVVQLIQSLKRERAERVRIEADEVLARLWRIATADPRELIRVHVTPCPDCASERTSMTAPDADCHSCAGAGRAVVVVGDTRHLSKAAAELFAGARMTRYGVQFSLHDQLKALELVGCHLGLWGAVAAKSPTSQDPLGELLASLRSRHATTDCVAAPPPCSPTRAWIALPRATACRN